MLSCPAAFNHTENGSTSRNQGNALQPQCWGAALRPYTSSSHSFLWQRGRGKAARSAHSQLCFHSPSGFHSLTLGHRISMTEDQPLIMGACRKLVLMGGHGSPQSIWRLKPSDQSHPLSLLLLGQAQSPGPFGAPTLWAG